MTKRFAPKNPWPPRGTGISTLMATVSAAVTERPAESALVFQQAPKKETFSQLLARVAQGGEGNTSKKGTNWITNPPNNRVCKPADHG